MQGEKVCFRGSKYIVFEILNERPWNPPDSQLKKLIGYLFFPEHLTKSHYYASLSNICRYSGDLIAPTKRSIDDSCKFKVHSIDGLKNYIKDVAPHTVQVGATKWKFDNHTNF